MRKDPDVRDGPRAGRKHYGELQEEVGPREKLQRVHRGPENRCASQLRNRVSAQSAPDYYGKKQSQRNRTEAIPTRD